MVFARKHSDGGKVWYASYPEIPSGKRIRRRVGRDKKGAQLAESAGRLDYERFKAGIYQPMAAADTLMSAVVEDYIAAMESGAFSRKGCPSTKHIDQVRGKLDVALFDMSMDLLADTQDGDGKMVLFLQRLLSGDVKDREGNWVGGGAGSRSGKSRTAMSACQRDEYGRLLKQFGNWLEDTDRVSRNPFRKFKAVMVSGRDETKVRMALTLEQINNLATAFPDYAAIYYVAATTGLRANEMRQLQWQHVKITGEEVPYIHLPAWGSDGRRQTKNATDAIIPLQTWVAEILVELRASQAALHGPVFDNFPTSKKLAPLVRLHAEFVGIADINEAGQVLDFHALRSSTATILFRLGVSLDKVQQIMRHSQIQTTIDHYRKFNGAADLIEGVAIPDPRRRQA